MENHSRRVHWLQHAEHEELGCIAPWLRQRGYPVTHTRLYAGDRLPSAAEFDWLIVMGGPMNIYEHERHPWLVPEKALINDACVSKKRVLGLCLGGQLIADALGGPVRKNEHSEIGFFDVYLTEDAAKYDVFSGIPNRFSAFHWHGDTFAIPPSCHNLIKSDACVNQAFAWGDRVLGLQFHLEVTEPDARRWLELEDLKPARYVQTAEQILREPARFAQNNALMVKLLENLDAI